jgi:myotubularin-related protein 5/13
MPVLTNINGSHYYCAVLSFYEKLSIIPSKPVDEEEENINLRPNLQRLPSTTTITHHNIMYAPKCLVLVSRLDYSDTFKNCLKTIYTVYLENLPYMIETLIGNILGCIQIPPNGGPQVRFSIGATDKQSLQPPLSVSLPGKN